MKIVFLLRPWPVFGGGETVTISLANEFVNRGHEVFVLYVLKTERENMPYVNPAIRAILVPNIHFDIQTTFSFNKEECNRAHSFLNDFVQKEKIDVVINQWWPVDAVYDLNKITKVIKCYHMAVFLKAKYSNLKWSGKDLFKKLMGRHLYWKLHKYSIHRQIQAFIPHVDKFVFLAPVFKKEYEEYLGEKSDKSKYDYCYNPLTYTKFATLDDICSKKNIVLFVGRMYDSHKNMTGLLKIWNEVEKDPKFINWRFVMVGDGADLQLSKDYAKKLKLKRVSFEGNQYPEDYFRCAKIFVMASHHEGWGMTLVEAQQKGCVPIVMDTFSSLHNIITDKENGTIIPMNDYDQYVKSLKALMSDDSTRTNYAKVGLQTCRRFTIENVCNRWELIFNELLNKENG